MDVDDRVAGFLGRVLDGEVPVGTCFQVADRVVVTAWHVMDDLGAGEPGGLVRVDPLRGGESTQARVVAVDRCMTSLCWPWRPGYRGVWRG